MNHPSFRPILTDRQERILALTERQGFVTIERLAEQFGVSAQTIRRDIIALADVGKLQRFHGGAGPSGNTETLRLDHSYKEQVAVEDKIRVARRAAAMVPDAASVYLDVGTTLEFTAKYLGARRGLRVFTNSIRAALTFDPAQQDVIVIGGRVAGK
ncbi:MAG: DeoR/GlpR transcriptional regulator, partial [Hyphomicrobiales bacterium]|nr:DeoR/GlpR transcriptional regulator [Hyphomicrobiales bacterium]